MHVNGVKTNDLVIGGIYKRKREIVRVIDATGNMSDPTVMFCERSTGDIFKMQCSKFLRLYRQETRGRKRKTDFNLARGR